MSESTKSIESWENYSSNYSEEISQLEIDCEQSFSSKDNNSNLVKKLENDAIGDDLKLTTEKNIEPKYPLTEWSKRKRAEKIRKERDWEFEQIKKTNDAITRGAEIIKDHTRVRKLENLKKINNNQWFYDETYSNGFKNEHLIKKIQTLELNLNNLENELIVEKNKLTSTDEYLTPEIETQNIITIENETNKDFDDNDKMTKKDLLNPIKYLEKSKTEKSVDICSLNNYVYETVQKIETRLHISPRQIEFKVVRMNLKPLKGTLKQQVKVSNHSKNTILCHYSHLFDPNYILEENINTIKVEKDTICRLQPGVTVDYVVKFKPIELPNSLTYLSLKGVKLVFETASNNRPDVKNVFHIPISFCMVKPEPELVTKTIIFQAICHSSENIDRKKYLIMKNNGDFECVFSVIKDSDCQKTNDSSHKIVSNYTADTTENSEKIIHDIINSILSKMFNYFVWKNHINVLLPAKGTVKVPVVFNYNLAYSSVSENYTILFDSREYIIPNQKVHMKGHIKDEILVKPDVIDVGLCYLANSFQVVSFHLQNNSKIVVPFKIRLPLELSKHVELRPSNGYLKAGSSSEIFIRLHLKYDILRPGGCEKYFDAHSGHLNFPIWVCPSTSKRSYEVRVLAVVTTSFGLKLTPETLNFGSVNTTETVVRNIVLSNHSKAAMNYGFLKLPEKVSILPSAFGTIFSGEQLSLHVHYSPCAKDLPQNVHTFEDEFIMTCSTITGLNVDKFNYKSVETIPQCENVSMYTSNKSKKSTTTLTSIDQINELDHGPNKIQILVLENTVKVDSLDENPILEEAMIKCRAKIHDVPVELSVQKIILGKTQYTSYSVFKIELKASNLASLIERNIQSFPDFKVKFEFISNDPSVEFKPKNGILKSKEVIQICVLYRPKLDSELLNIYDECLSSEIINIRADEIVKDENSYINQIYKKKYNLREQIKLFEANSIFYSSMKKRTKIIAAVCFVRFIEQKSIEYFGFDTESLKLSLVCPTTKPNIVLLSDRINFGKCAMNVRHNEWLFIRNVTMHPVPLTISPTNPTGPFFCAFALNGEHSLFSGHTIPINVSFTPEHEITVSEVLEVTSGTTRLMVKISGSGLKPSCKITPDNVFNIIQISRERINNTFIFQVENTGKTSARFNMQMEWSKKRSGTMTEDEAKELVARTRTFAAREPGTAAINADTAAVDPGTAAGDAETAAGDPEIAVEDPGRTMAFDEPEWITTVPANQPFNLENGGSLRFHLDSGASRLVHVAFEPALLPVEKTGEDDDEPEEQEQEQEQEQETEEQQDARRLILRAYAAKFNVHVGRSVLNRFYLLGLVETSS